MDKKKILRKILRKKKNSRVSNGKAKNIFFIQVSSESHRSSAREDFFFFSNFY